MVPRTHYPLHTCLLLACLAPAPARAQPGRIVGMVLEAESRQPVQFVTVTLSDSAGIPVDTATTDSKGTFSFDELAFVTYTLAFNRIGYQRLEKQGVLPERPPFPDQLPPMIVVMVTAPFVTAETVIVTASRSPETGFRAPASTSVITRKNLDHVALLTPVDPARTVPGVDFASKGMLQHTYAIRGHRSVNSGALLVMTDYRYAGVPALDINVPYLLSLSKDDIDRIEIARGPGSALYGPNSDRGILHLITRSPLSSRGTSLSLAMGEREVLRGRLRHAGASGSKLGYKLSAEYFRGADWAYVDPEEQQQRQMELDGGADPDTLRTGMRDNSIERVAGEARVDWTPASGSEWTATAGVADAINIVDLTPNLGGVQVKDWLYPYLQLQTKQGQFYANAFYNGSSSGDTYALRSGDFLVDDSWLSAIQVQHKSRFGRATLNYGVDARHTESNTKGTINGRYEANDTMSELGAYLSVNRPLGEELTLVGALRGDYHDRINDITVSPRLGLLIHPDSSQAMRITYNRAFSSPDAIALFIDARRGSLGQLPYDVRASAVPKDGFTFARNCNDGPCMQTPWEQLPDTLPADATWTWDVLDSLLGALYGLDIPDSIAAPDASQVGTDLRLLDPNDPRGPGFPVQPDDVLDVPGPRRVIRNTLEAGYKALLGDRAAVSADIYWTHIKDNKGPPRTVTPNVFFDQETLEAYLIDHGMSPEDAAAVADAASQLPMGTVSPDQVGESSDILIVDHQVGDYSYSFWGVDLEAEVKLSQRIVLGGNYSFFHNNVIEGVDIVGSVILSVPKHKGATWIRYRDEEGGWSAGLTGRAVGKFPVDSGVYRGNVDGYAVLDLDFGYRLARTPRINLSLDAVNVFDDRHQEYVDAPELGRLVMVNLQMGF